MTQEETKEKVIDSILPCLKSDDMQITDDALCNIIIDCKVQKPFTEAMKSVAQWFNNAELENGKGVSEMCDIDQTRYVGAVINLLTLLAAGDVVTLVEKWVLSDLN